LGNHDRPRLASRIGAAQTRVAAMLLLTLRGTPTLYYGDEIGMRQVAIAPAQVRDPWEKNVPGFGVGRDGCRTPMQWDDSANAGFSAAEPWLPLADDFTANNVASERDDPHSLYNLYRQLLSVRRKQPALAVGAYYPVAAAGNVLAYERVLGVFRTLVVLNLGAITADITLPNKTNSATILLSTEPCRDGLAQFGTLTLKGHEGVILELDA
jgi:alpha-glucosidase